MPRLPYTCPVSVLWAKYQPIRLCAGDSPAHSLLATISDSDMILLWYFSSEQPLAKKLPQRSDFKCVQFRSRSLVVGKQNIMSNNRCNQPLTVHPLVYVLECTPHPQDQVPQYYVGFSQLDLHGRLATHWAGRGSRFTRQYPPVRIHSVRWGGPAVERDTTIQLAKAHGAKYVRGAQWCSGPVPAHLLQEAVAAPKPPPPPPPADSTIIIRGGQVEVSRGAEWPDWPESSAGKADSSKNWRSTTSTPSSVAPETMENGPDQSFAQMRLAESPSASSACAGSAITA